MKISTFGLGYVGTVSLACLANKGIEGIGVDINGIKVDFINQGKSPIVEGGIDEIIREQQKQGRISATLDGVSAVQNTEVSFICVGTPPTENGHLDLRGVLRVSQQIGKGIRQKSEFHVVAVRSTVLPGTCENVASLIEEVSGKKRDEGFAVVSNPEFLREGTAVRDYYNPPFTLVGTDCSQAAEKMRALYKDISGPFMVCDAKSAEMIKYVNNAFHALKICFANEVGNICKRLNMDSHKLMDIFCLDHKLNISPYYLKPGFAYGGSCLPKDLKALTTIAHDQYVNCPVIQSIGVSNELQKKMVIERILGFGKRKVGFVGLSFKAGTDDLRNSPIVDVIELLLGKGFDVRVYDKNVYLSRLIGGNKEYIEQKIPLISEFLSEDLDEVLNHAEVVVIVNNYDGLAERLDSLSESKIVFDLVNISAKSLKTRANYIGIAW
jgi:GDP-mannose 6-dehydrogenase